MKVILTSKNSEFRKKLNSDSFIMANYRDHYDEYTKEHSSYLDLNHVPQVGEHMYFIDNTFNQIALYVDSVAYNLYGSVLVCCNEASLDTIDPYLYEGNDISKKVKYDILWAYKICQPRFEKKYQKKIQAGEECDRFSFISNYINDYLGLSKNTIIEYTNVIYIIKEVISNEYPDLYHWRRPYDWEYSDM